MRVVMTDLSRPTPPGTLPDKRQVAASFSRAAASYDSVAALQRAVGLALLGQLLLTCSLSAGLTWAAARGISAAPWPSASALRRVWQWTSPKACCAMPVNRAGRIIMWRAMPSGCRCAMTVSTGVL